MRGLVGGLWLAAAATLLHVAKGDTVTFVVEDFDGGQVSSKIVGAARRGAFQVAQGGTPLSTRTFAWRATNLRVEMINLLVHDTTVPKQFRIVGRGSPVKQNDQTTNLGTAVTDVGDDPAEGNSTAQRRDVNQKRQPQSEGTNPTLGDPRSIIKLDVTSTTDGGSVTIADLSKVIHRAQPLYFEAIWPSVSGKSYSPAFAVLNNTDDDGLVATGEFPKIFSNEPFLLEAPQSTDLDSGTGTGTGTSSGPTASATVPPSSANGGSGSSSGSSGSSGLPIGAQAGIGAACGVLGLLLIAFAVWYFLRKKKRRQQHGAIAPYDETGISRTRTDELMAAEKEANLSSSAAAVSGSPYSDADATRALAHRSSMSGGGGAAAPLIAPVAVAAAAAVSPADGPPSYTPYTDRPASGAGSGTAAGEPAVVSTQYAHLVEEGMTAEQIRRLEEEERALDAAIEQAVRRPTG